jgi:hypothetical protein
MGSSRGTEIMHITITWTAQHGYRVSLVTSRGWESMYANFLHFTDAIEKAEYFYSLGGVR